MAKPGAKTLMSSRGLEDIDPRMMDPYATIGFALKQAHQALRQRLDTDLRAIGLTTPQYAVLTYLAAHSVASGAEIARSTFVTPQTMHGILAGLEKEDLVSRTSDPNHGRIKAIAITGVGRSLQARATKLVAETEALLSDAFPEYDASELISIFRRASAALT